MAVTMATHNTLMSLKLYISQTAIVLFSEKKYNEIH